MGIIVQKYGGTSVGTGERLRNVASVIESTRQNQSVIAVVSAMSGRTKSEGTTSLLLKAAELAQAGQSFAEPVDAIGRAHFAALDEIAEDDHLKSEVQAWLMEEMRRLNSFLEAVQVIRELSPRSQDILMGTGERFSARLLTACLQDRNIPARYVDLANVVPEDLREVEPAFFQNLQERIAETARPELNEVPVVTGFFGMVPGGLLKTVGRGYSDFTAALIAAGLGNQECIEMQVWKEVDGIFTADPRRVPSAHPLSEISPTEASELTYFGSEVLHPFTMERVVAADVPIRIKNTFNPDAPGTVIREAPSDKKRITAVTAKRGITVVTLHSNRMYAAHGFLARVFDILSDNEVVVDLIATSEVSITFTVEDEQDVKWARDKLRQLGTITIEPHRAILAVVGEGMKYAKGTAGRMMMALGDAGINIEVISQGASEINISCVIQEADAERGLQAIHRAFLEEE